MDILKRMIKGPRNRGRRFGAVATLLASQLAGAGALANHHPTEGELKAAFLFNVALLVEWPQETGGEFPICVLGDDPFDGALEALAGKQIGGRAIVLRRPPAEASLTSCRILFIAGAERGRTAKTLKRIGGQPVLSVSDQPGFVDRGGIIELFREGPRMRFSINLDAVYGSGLELGSQLLKMAHAIKRTEW